MGSIKQQLISVHLLTSAVLWRVFLEHKYSMILSFLCTDFLTWKVLGNANNGQSYAWLLCLDIAVELAQLDCRSLTKHYKTHAGDNTVTCRTCHATFPSVAGLLNHRKTHAPPGSSSDWEMSPVATSSVTSTAPVSNFAGGVPLLTATPVSSPSTTNLNSSGSESFRCPRCDKLLSSKLSLALHTRVHTGEKPFECGVCHKRFTQKPALTYHMRLHTGERPHICRFCGKGFNSKVGKESHERIHTGERPYRCGQCGVGFRCSANLRQHTWIHTDSRPFTCNICHKPFRRREALQVHTRTHTGERPYQCPRCGRRFTQKGDMLKHARSHDRPGGGRAPAAPAATCGTCGQTFAQRKHLKAHRCLLATKPTDSPADIIAIDTDDIITFPEITVVTNDTQDFDVGYVS
ncbi:zinc finger protein OZF-like [Schistocerca serialis cubense]|uniref:zinc finger protein OZF-like n=1 Tax=Schistocerca serialis cubense TaxID=2023355 RepID=UPI00214E402A|nr:zinc finger protein OZF-like [Schistocerca serialis cubense]